MKRSLNHSGRGWPTLLVLGYALLGWPIGVWMLLRPEIWANVLGVVLGVVLVAHSLIYSAYMIHDCVHHAIFSTASGNDRLGILMSLMNGACVASYARPKKKHLRHHSDRLDVVTFDYRAALNGTAPWLRQGELALEWAYVPAVELMMRGALHGCISAHVRGVCLALLGSRRSGPAARPAL